jgi:signal transduction histidine kinase
LFSMNKSLRLRFLAATIPMMVLLVVGMFLSFDYFINNIIDGLNKRFAAQQVYYDRGRTVQPVLQEIVLARKLARSPAIIDWALDEENPHNEAQGLAELESMRKIFRDGSYFFIINKSGHYFFNDAKNTYAGRQLRYTLSPEKVDDAWYYATLKNPKECQLNVNNDTELKVTKVWINCLVRQNGEVIGVIGTGIELTKFISSVLNVRQDGVINMFIDGDGAIQAHKDAKFIDFHTLTKDADAKKTVYQLLPDHASREYLRGLLQKIKASPENTETTYLTISGQKNLVGIAYLKEINWFNLTVMTPSVWALGQGFMPLAVLMVVGMLLTLVFGAMIIHRIVLSRISRLDSAIEKIKDNDYALNLDDDNADEIGRLTTSFVEMAGVAQKNRQALELEVTERTQDLVEARDEAQAANQAKSEFLAMMSHDLRTPLNAIIGFSDMIRSKIYGPVGDKRYVNYLDDINDSGHLLLNLINVILDISKIESGKFDLQEADVDLRSFLLKSIKLISFEADEGQVNLSLSHAKIFPLLRCDIRTLSQIINNLLSNGIKFSNENGSVMVSTELLEDNSITIKVCDSGIGMDEEGTKKALEPFSQADSGSARKYEGTGLGLHVSQLLMVRHGGSLDIESTIGKGTTVTLRFPPERTISSLSELPPE